MKFSYPQCVCIANCLQESKAAQELADKVLSDVQRSSTDMAELNAWLQVRCSASVHLQAHELLALLTHWDSMDAGDVHIHSQGGSDNAHLVNAVVQLSCLSISAAFLIADITCACFHLPVCSVS